MQVLSSVAHKGTGYRASVAPRYDAFNSRKELFLEKNASYGLQLGIQSPPNYGESHGRQEQNKSSSQVEFEVEGTHRRCEPSRDHDPGSPQFLKKD